MFYERKIKYFDYIENGEKIKNAGFAKIEVRDTECNIDIQIKGVPIKESIKREISLNGYDKTSLLGELMLQDGEGNIRLHKCNRMALGSSGLTYNELENIEIAVDGTRIIRCLWAPRSSKQIEEEHKSPEEKKIKEEGLFHLKDKFRVERKNKAEDILKSKEVLDSKNKVETQDIQNIEDIKQEKLPKVDWESKKEEKLPIVDRKSPKEECSKADKEENTNFREDKWSQIASIYPSICPFEDEREYLLIQPRDFVMLSGRSYPLVNNSFLLHGYYNYNHLVLARKQGRGEEFYYIGVPGNFYDREKQVAIMFGFESFECKEEPAGHGDYGYYMIRVDL